MKSCKSSPKKSSGSKAPMSKQPSGPTKSVPFGKGANNGSKKD